MVERFFLDRINTKSGRTSVSGEHDLLVLPSAHKAEPALAFVQLAIARTNIALDASVRQIMPIAGWVTRNRLIHAAPDLIFPQLYMVLSWRPGKMQLRKPAVAGSFYPAQPDRLRRQIEELLAKAEPAPKITPKALIAPHAGYIYSGLPAATAFATLRDSAQAFARIVLIGPAHYVAIRGVALPTSDAFETPLGRVPVDHDALAEITGLPFVSPNDA